DSASAAPSIPAPSAAPSEEYPSPAPSANPQTPYLQKVIVQLQDPQHDSAFRIMENTDATLFNLAHEIDGTILKALVRGEQNITIEGENIDGNSYPAIAESSEDMEFEDGRYCQAKASAPSSTWIRLYYSNSSPKGTPAGGNPPTHKDIVAFIDPKNPKDALLAWQSLDNPTNWTVYRLPDFGGWLDIELRFCNH
ncbi:MAG: hypothetical protein RR209_03890, partial [Angelakisella sp.]